MGDEVRALVGPLEIDKEQFYRKGGAEKGNTLKHTAGGSKAKSRYWQFEMLW